MAGFSTNDRNRRFDILRLAFAVTVLLAHAPEITDGNRSRELLARLTGVNVTLGMIAVDGFFLLSGYLILQSWLREPKLKAFLKKRFTRIVPGYLTSALLSTLAVGLLAPGSPLFFTHLGKRYLFSLARLTAPSTPPVFPGLPFPTVNASLWTIGYEALCYLFVAVLGASGLLKRRYVWLGFTLVLVAGFNWSDSPLLRLTTAFFLGGAFLLYAEWIKRRALAVAFAFGAVLLAGALHSAHFEWVTLLAGSYVLFSFVKAGSTPRKAPRSFPDISYGVYLYGWPLESLWIYFHRGSPWIAFAASTGLAFLCGVASWYAVEAPSLRLLRRPRRDLVSFNAGSAGEVSY